MADRQGQPSRYLCLVFRPSWAYRTAVPKLCIGQCCFAFFLILVGVSCLAVVFIDHVAHLRPNLTGDMMPFIPILYTHHHLKANCCHVTYSSFIYPFKVHCCHITYFNVTYPLPLQSTLLACHLFQHCIPIAVPKLIVMSLIPAPDATQRSFLPCRFFQLHIPKAISVMSLILVPYTHLKAIAIMSLFSASYTHPKAIAVMSLILIPHAHLKAIAVMSLILAPYTHPKAIAVMSLVAVPITITS